MQQLDKTVPEPGWQKDAGSARLGGVIQGGSGKASGRGDGDGPFFVKQFQLWPTTLESSRKSEAIIVFGASSL